MMQGDQYRLPIELNHKDGAPIGREEVKDIEIFIGGVRKTISSGDVNFDESEKTFYIYIYQKETFMLRGDVKAQARILFPGGDVIGVNLGTINIETSVSKVVLK